MKEEASALWWQSLDRPLFGPNHGALLDSDLMSCLEALVLHLSSAFEQSTWVNVRVSISLEWGDFNLKEA